MKIAKLPKHRDKYFREFNMKTPSDIMMWLETESDWAVDKVSGPDRGTSRGLTHSLKPLMIADITAA